jgi:putative membrane protein
MIKNFTDHAANERTFLAWVRTAIAVMAFGFLIERFDLFLHAITPSSAGRNLSAVGERFANAGTGTRLDIALALLLALLGGSLCLYLSHAVVAAF